MWIATAAVSWIIGSIGLYAYLVHSATEMQGECADCRETQCAGCPVIDSSETNKKVA